MTRREIFISELNSPEARCEHRVKHTFIVSLINPNQNSVCEALKIITYQCDGADVRRTTATTHFFIILCVPYTPEFRPLVTSLYSPIFGN